MSKIITKEEVERRRKEYSKNRKPYRKANASKAVLKHGSPNRGINDPAEIARRVALMRQAKLDYMVKHGEVRLPNKVVRAIDLDGRRA